MKKLYVIAISTVVCACTGSLSDEQRKAVKEDMAAHEIKRVTEVEITEAAFAEGRKLVAQLESLGTDQRRIDSAIEAHDGSIRWIVPGAKNALEVEQQLIEAYMSSEGGEQVDNVQHLRRSDNSPSDSILYSKPILKSQGDSGDQLVGVWNIWLSQKALIRGMTKK